MGKTNQTSQLCKIGNAYEQGREDALKEAKQSHDKILAELKDANTRLLTSTHQISQLQDQNCKDAAEIDQLKGRLRQVLALTRYGEPNQSQIYQQMNPLMGHYPDTPKPYTEPTNPDAAPIRYEERSGYLAGLLQAIRTIAE
jgi:hypothetical protein